MPNPQKDISGRPDVETAAPEQSDTQAVVDVYLELPRSYKKEYAAVFKTLPPALRRYLHERESEIERGFSKINNELNAKRWIDDIFGSRAERLCRHGIRKPQEWIEAMAQIDDALDSNPCEALRYLTEVYGVKDLFPVSVCQPSGLEGVTTRLSQLENSLQELCVLIKDSRLQSHKIEEAQKAKEAAFSPRGKISRKDLSELSTREVLELKMSEYD